LKEVGLKERRENPIPVLYHKYAITVPKGISNMFGYILRRAGSLMIYVLAEDTAGSAADTRKVRIFLIIDDLF